MEAVQALAVVAIDVAAVVLVEVASAVEEVGSELLAAVARWGRSVARRRWPLELSGGCSTGLGTLD